jgi:NAD(P)-dependent dehydrogenase (short-subunit alcohol dehydrogenase family)
MDLGLSGRCALVTGASRGIGYAIAECLAAEGCHLHITSRTASAIEQAAERLATRYDVKITPHVHDLSDPTEVARLSRACGNPDILVNNAGAIPKGDFETLEDAALREGWDLKLFGYLNLARPIYSAMRARGSGVIINIIGIAGLRPPYNGVAGCAANAAIIAFTTALGSHSMERGVRVVGINPGPTKTERQLGRFREQARVQLGDASRFAELLPPQPMGEPENIGDAVAFLASDRARFISGTILTVDGGLSARSPLFAG